MNIGPLKRKILFARLTRGVNGKKNIKTVVKTSVLRIQHLRKNTPRQKTKNLMVRP